MRKGFKSMIAAVEVVSESEIAALYPKYNYHWEEERKEDFLAILFKLGIDTSKPFERQDGLQHRNRLNQVVTCSRWVGTSRLDHEWLNSGLATKEAKDKAQNSRLLDELYRSRGLTEDIQAMLEARDNREKLRKQEDTEDAEAFTSGDGTERTS